MEAAERQMEPGASCGYRRGSWRTAGGHVKSEEAPGHKRGREKMSSSSPAKEKEKAEFLLSSGRRHVTALPLPGLTFAS